MEFIKRCSLGMSTWKTRYVAHIEIGVGAVFDYGSEVISSLVHTAIIAAGNRDAT
jgi:hypothetical protein